ncbi:MAG: cyclase family protein [Acidobacteria bacterium]|nr:cyclase family protein [Acidobacteriota bacterium]
MFVDLSHTITHDMITYPGLPSPSIRALIDHDDSVQHYGPGTTFHIGQIEMVANTGTYLDAPFHRFIEGSDISRLDLSTIANLAGILVSVQAASRSIGPESLAGLDVSGKAVLFHTGWSIHFGTPQYAVDYPFLAAETALELVNQGAALVGIDALNIDDNRDPIRPVHTTLLQAGIPIVEHLTGLSPLSNKAFRFFAVPPKVEGLGSFPVRAFALL